MKTQLQRPQMKMADVKVTDADLMYFSLGLDKEDFVLPSDRNDYTSDDRAVALVQAVQAGKDLSGQDFSGINLKGADISGGIFKGAKFNGSLFYKTKARNCDFEGADFSDSYMEEMDAGASIFTGAVFHRIYARRVNLDKAVIDTKDQARFDALEFLIQQIESGKIDIKHLSKADLLHLDLRRLDLSKVDLDGIDLSYFDLEGVNLRGTYVDPKQLMSLDGLMHYYKMVQQMTVKKIKMLALKFVQSHQQELKQYAINEQKQAVKKPSLPSDKLKRPPFKDNALPEMEKMTPKITDEGQDSSSPIQSVPHKIAGKAKSVKKTKLRM